MLECYIQKGKIQSGQGGLVQDKQGKTLYYFSGKIGQANDSLILHGPTGVRLAKIVQTSTSFGTHFDLYLMDEKKARMTKLINWPMMTYIVPAYRWVVHGDLNRHTYHIQSGTKTVMDMYPANTLMGEVFAIEVHNFEDIELSLCIASVLDYWVQEKKNAEKRVVAGYPFPVS